LCRLGSGFRMHPEHAFYSQESWPDTCATAASHLSAKESPWYAQGVTYAPADASPTNLHAHSLSPWKFTPTTFTPVDIHKVDMPCGAGSLPKCLCAPLVTGDQDFAEWGGARELLLPVHRSCLATLQRRRGTGPNLRHGPGQSCSSPDSPRLASMPREWWAAGCM